MIIVLRPNATEEQIQHLLDKIEEAGLTPHTSRGTERTIVGVIGDERILRNMPLEVFPGVENVMSILKPYKFVSREFQKENTKIKIKDFVIGGDEIIISAGPCSVEPGDIIFEIAHKLKSLGVKMLRGGAFKPRTSPYDFQGMGEEGLKMLAEASRQTGLAVITEVMDTRQVDLVYKYVDAFQIGARNVQNFNLLKEVGKTDKPVLLKRGMSTTIKEWLMSAEYIISEGNRDIILCERGIRTFETMTRNTLDVAAVPVLKEETHLPVFVDPSHACGIYKFVNPLARAAVAAGADGLIIEVHPKPEAAFSDGAQSLKYDKFEKLINDIKPVAAAVGRKL